MVCVNTTKEINLAQLGSELGTLVGTGPVGLRSSTGTICIADEATTITQAQLQQVIDAHVADPSFGEPVEVKALYLLRDLLRDIRQGTKAFQNNAERDKAIAACALILLKDHGII